MTQEVKRIQRPNDPKDQVTQDSDPALPLGTRTHSMKLAFHGGEIYFLHLDAFGDREDLVLSRIAADAPTMLRPSYPAFAGVNVDETILTPRIIEAIVDVLADERKVFRKIAIVGCSGKDRRVFERALAEARVDYPVAFINDFEKAKEWLI